MKTLKPGKLELVLMDGDQLFVICDFLNNKNKLKAERKEKTM